MPEIASARRRGGAVTNCHAEKGAFPAENRLLAMPVAMPPWVRIS
jgi:hypothetical protein